MLATTGNKSEGGMASGNKMQLEYEAALARADHFIRNAPPDEVAKLLVGFAKLLYESHHVEYGRGNQCYGLPVGLCDAVDRDGEPYPSQWCHDLLRRAAKMLGKKLQWLN